MKLFNSTPSAASTGNGKQARRSFLQVLGIGVSTALGSAAAIAKPAPRHDLARQLTTLEAEKALEALLQRYEDAMDAGRSDEVLALFTDDAQVVFNGGVFSGAAGRQRLYLQHFAAGNSGKRMPAAPGFTLPPAPQQPRITLAEAASSATLVIPYSIQVGRPLVSENSLAGMAQAQGEGVRSWWEGGLYRAACVRDVRDGSWKIARLTYDTVQRADYRAGRSQAHPIRVAAFTACYPEHPQGPDFLV